LPDGNQLIRNNLPNPDLHVIEQLYLDIQAKEQRVENILSRLILNYGKGTSLPNFAANMD
jgi:hypothetical protein